MAQIRTPESLLATLGGVPERIPLDLRVLDVQEQENCTRQLVEYAIDKEERIQAFLLLPHQQTAKVPGILAIHQDGATRPYSHGKSEVAGLGGDPALKYGLELCQRGYVVICPDRFPFESRSLANSPFKEVFEQFRIFLRTSAGEVELTEDLYQGCVANRLLLQGYTPLGRELFELQRAIDCLCTHPQVNEHQIGVIGHSAGGVLSAYVMYIDPRVKAGCASCGTWLSRLAFNQQALRPINGFGGVTPGLQKWGDLDDILAGLAPRPYLETRGDPETAEQTAQLTHKAILRYAELGVADKFQYITYDGGHTFRQDMREKSYTWFDRWLDLKTR